MISCNQCEYHKYPGEEICIITTHLASKDVCTNWKFNTPLSQWDMTCTEVRMTVCGLDDPVGFKQIDWCARAKDKKEDEAYNKKIVIRMLIGSFIIAALVAFMIGIFTGG